MLRLVLRKYSRFLLPANEPFPRRAPGFVLLFLSSQTREGANEGDAMRRARAPVHVNRLRPF
jgi:hypothetical protein